MESKEHGGRWKPGQSGNPKGRPRTGQALTEAIRKLVEPEKLVRFALERLEGNGFQEKDRQWAADWLAKQGFKLPAQVLEVAQVEYDETNLAALPTEDLKALASGE